MNTEYQIDFITQGEGKELEEAGCKLVNLVDKLQTEYQRALIAQKEREELEEERYKLVDLVNELQKENYKTSLCVFFEFIGNKDINLVFCKKQIASDIKYQAFKVKGYSSPLDFPTIKKEVRQILDDEVYMIVDEFFENEADFIPQKIDYSQVHCIKYITRGEIVDYSEAIGISDELDHHSEYNLAVWRDMKRSVTIVLLDISGDVIEEIKTQASNINYYLKKINTIRGAK